MGEKVELVGARLGKDIGKHFQVDALLFEGMKEGLPPGRIGPDLVETLPARGVPDDL